MKGNEHTKCKKPPACDYCKARRVICHAQVDGPCPRCREKGVSCVTTPPQGRRRRRTKAEMQEERAQKMDAKPQPVDVQYALQVALSNDAEAIQGVDGSMNFSSDSSQGLDLGTPNPVSPSLNLPPKLIAELFEVFRILPQSLHPIIPLDELEFFLRLASWDLASLPLQMRSLAQIIVTVASFFSTNAAIVGSEGCGPGVASIALSKSPLKEPAVPDLREYGVRRRPVCYQLQAEALWLAHQAGITVHVSRENAASCWLLDFLECRLSGQGVSTYASAYNGHLRCLAETNISALPGCSPNSSETSVLYGAYMMHDAVYAITSRRSIPFSHNDELLIVGSCTTSLEKLLQMFLSSASSKEIYLSMDSFTSNIIHVARESSERLTGVYARRQPLDENFLATHFAELELLHSILLAERDRALHLVQDLTESHFLRSCAYALHIAWGCLVFSLYELLLDRLLVCEANTSTSDARERLEAHFVHAKQLAFKAVVGISDALKDVPCISRITHLHCGELSKWARFLLEESKAVAKGHETLQALKCYRDALKIVGFSWVDHSGFVEIIDEYIASQMVHLPSCALRDGEYLYLEHIS